MAVNHAVFIGRLTKDPGSQYTQSGKLLAKFSIAVDRNRKNPETGEKETDFFNCVAWERTAEFVTQYLGKGRLVAVEGRVQNRSWIADDGQKRTVTEIQVDNVQALDRSKEGEEAEAAQGNGGHAVTSYSPPAEQDPFA